MIKKFLVGFALSLLGLTPAFAGTMGEVKTLPVLIPFFSGEGLYAWPDVEGFHIQVNNVGTFDSIRNNQGWGGRLAVGALHPLTQTVAGSAEVGWGYYGEVDMTPKLTLDSGLQVQPTRRSINSAIEQFGFDVLAGLVYSRPQYDLFFKVGALIQNLRFKASVNPQELAANSTSTIARRLNGTYSFATTLVNALPELKLGGGYYLNEDWLVTVAWMHAFGSSLSISAPNLTAGTAALSLGDITAQIRSPTLNVVMFGLEYRFNT